MASHEEPRNYPFLSNEEFSLACHFLDQKYITAYLGQERRAFRLRLQHSMISDAIYLSITRPIDISYNDLNITLDLQALGWEEKDDFGDILMDMDAEDTDSDAVSPNPKNKPDSEVVASQSEKLPGYTPQAQQPYVVYEIHLHPTYQTPVLWFSLHDLPPCDSPLDIDIVYRYLVPDQYKNHLRAVGVIGGISAANHPITDVPAFFIHPCATKEAMEQFRCSLQGYLSIWLGLVGGFVGLSLPLAMA